MKQEFQYAKQVFKVYEACIYDNKSRCLYYTKQVLKIPEVDIYLKVYEYVKQVFIIYQIGVYDM